MNKKCAIILAGGKGTRMKTQTPKVMCEVLFKPMVSYVIDAVKEAGCEDVCVVTGHCREIVEAALPADVETAFQAERLGTGHAVMQTTDFISRHIGWDVLILNGDGPMIDAETINQAYDYHRENNNMITLISAYVDDTNGIGHIKRDENGVLERIIEHKDANDEEKKINESNAGIYWFNAEKLLYALSKITNNNVQNEYYLTDTLAILIADGCNAGGFVVGDATVTLGANDRIQLNHLNTLMRDRINKKLMLEGVDIPCTDGVMIGKDVKIGNDTTILPNTIITGNTVIGHGCKIGPNCILNDAKIGDNAVLSNTRVDTAEMADGSDAGPYANIHKGSKLCAGVHIGNFVEVKNSVVGEKTKSAHLTYIGDSNVGSGVNFGCGVVTVNYDGKNKSRTIIGNNAFIGCNTNLIAPVQVGDNAYIAAGSTITDQVPADALSIARAKQVNKDGWVTIKKPYKEKK